jgi:hypothetical protein
MEETRIINDSRIIDIPKADLQVCVKNHFAALSPL